MVKTTETAASLACLGFVEIFGSLSIVKWRCRQSAANPSLPKFAVYQGKNSEFLQFLASGATSCSISLRVFSKLRRNSLLQRTGNLSARNRENVWNWKPAVPSE